MKAVREDFKFEKYELECNFNKKYKKLENQNIFLQKIIEKFEKNIKIFISWICKKFKISESENVAQNFKKETGIDLYSR